MLFQNCTPDPDSKQPPSLGPGTEIFTTFFFLPPLKYFEITHLFEIFLELINFKILGIYVIY